MGCYKVGRWAAGGYFHRRAADPPSLCSNGGARMTILDGLRGMVTSKTPQFSKLHRIRLMKYEWLVLKETLRLSYCAFSSTSKICPIRSNFFGEHGTDPLDPPLPCSLSYLSPIFLSLLRSFLYPPLHPPKLTKTAPPPAPPSLPLPPSLHPPRLACHPEGVHLRFPWQQNTNQR